MASARRRLKGKTGEYQLLAPLTQSGISSVHLARRLEVEGWDRFVVFRELLPHLLQDDRAVEQFLQEARIAVRFVHPNLVRVLEAGKSKAGIFSVVEYLSGDGLGSILAVGQLPPALAAGLIAQAAAGLAFAHSLTNKKGEPLNVVHRNVNPRNLVIEPDGRAKLINFDIARPADRPHPTRLTAYLSPEQCVGRPIGPASDVFSLGVVLWEALAGHHLFKRPDDMDTRRAVMACQVPGLASVRPDTPELLEKITRRALAKDQAERFSSATEMAAALQQACEMIGLDASQDAVAAHLAEVLGDRVAAKRRALELLEASGEADVDTRILLPDSSIELPLLPAGPPSAPAAGLPPRPVDDAFAVPPPVVTELGLPRGSSPGELEEPDEPVTMQNLAPRFTSPAERTPPPLPKHPGSQPEPPPPAAAPAVPPPPVQTDPAPTLDSAPVPEHSEVSAEMDALDASAPAIDDMGATRIEQEPEAPDEAAAGLQAEPAEVDGATPTLEDLGMERVASEDEREVTPPPFQPSLRVRRPFERYLLPGAIAGGVLLLLLIIVLAWPSGEAEEPTDQPRAGAAEGADQQAAEELEIPEAPARQAEKLRLARLEITSDPVGCQVSLSGMVLQGLTPLTNVIVPAGVELEVAVACADHKSESRLVTAREGEHLPVEFYPNPVVKPGKPQFGRLQLTTGRPVTVFLGKKRLGQTPLVGKRLPAGIHKLRLVRKSDGIDETIQVNIPAGDVEVVEKQL